jgi:hypothetical protein
MDQSLLAAHEFLSTSAATAPDSRLLETVSNGARAVAQLATATGTAPHEFVASAEFLACVGLGDLAEPQETPVRHYLHTETDRRLAGMLTSLLDPADIALAVEVGRRHGRTTMRGLLGALVPFIVELEHGLAIEIAHHVRHALERAA